MSVSCVSISSHQAPSPPDRHHLKRRASFHAAAGFFAALSINRLIGHHSPLHYANKVARHSRVLTVPARRDGSYQSYSLLPPECRDSPEKSSAEMPPESLAHGHRVSSVVRSLSLSVAPPLSDRSPLPIA